VPGWCTTRSSRKIWDVEIADAQRVKGLAPLACKTDKIDSRVLAVLSQRDLVPAIWLPDPRIPEERELARFRLHLVKHKSALKHRVHSTLINFGKPCPVTDLFGVEGRKLLARLHAPQPWRDNIRIGKYTRFKFRRNRPPRRVDGCLWPGAPRMSPCPEAWQGTYDRSIPLDRGCV
jgi:hypothetical protein